MSFQGKEVLITGGAGFIGSNLALRLVEDGAKVTVLDAMLPSAGGNLFNLRPCRDAVRFVQLNMREGGALPEIVRDKEYIFNLAGQVSHQDSIADPISDMESNICSALNLLEACRHHNPEARVIYTGTRQVYGRPKYLPVDEAHPLNPVDFNGISNLAGEEYHLLYSNIFGIKTVCFRLTNTYGPRLLIKHPRQGFIGWFVNRALMGQPIHLFGGGKQIRDLNFVEDVVDALLLAITEERCLGKVFNLSGERADLFSVASQLVGLTGKGRVVSVPFPEDLKIIDIGDYYCTSRCFSDLTGWIPKVGLDEGLKRTMAYYQENRSHYLENDA